MLQVKTPDEVLELIREEFSPLSGLSETVGLDEAIGRVLSEDILASEYVPDFNRSTVDGYAVKAGDTFGCSDSIPAVLRLRGEVLMGQGAAFALSDGECCAVPTGGAIPEGADCAVMIEYTEDFGDGTVGISKPGAPGMNMIFRGDDVYPGKVVLQKGRILSAQDIGALAAIGKAAVPVVRKLKVGVISTGDELVPPDQIPGPGQMRDVNAPMLCAMLKAFGADAVNYGIMKDSETMISEAVHLAADACDAVLISGGSSVGVKDASCRIIESMGKLLLHGIAMKPGKPAILGKTKDGIPIFGLPGHPVAAYFVTKLFFLPILETLEGRTVSRCTVRAVLAEDVGANHGRAQYSCVHLERQGDTLIAHPVRSKSGLITSLAGADGYFCIERDCEGLSRGSVIDITICTGD